MESPRRARVGGEARKLLRKDGRTLHHLRTKNARRLLVARVERLPVRSNKSITSADTSKGERQS